MAIDVNPISGEEKFLAADTNGVLDLNNKIVDGAIEILLSP